VTEYELIDLAISQSEVVSGVRDSLQSVVTIYLSMVAGYLVIAYLAGAALTKVQVTVVTAAFLAASGWAVTAIVSLGFAELVARKISAQLWARVEELSIIETSTASPSWFINLPGICLFLTLIIGVIAPLYFMWSVRRPRGE
jgi:hypothetical protein